MAGAPDAPAPMEGGGAYNRRSAVQATGLSPALPIIEVAASAVPLVDSPEPVVVVDYGVSEGRNSMEPIRVARDALRRRVGSERAISVVHTDLPSNDFCALFGLLDTDPGSYMHGDACIFPSAIGRSFYGPVLPPGSVTLGWSSWAVQWLSRVPGPIPDQLQIAFSHDREARAVYAAQAAADWVKFLQCRAVELRPGGRIVIVTMALDAEGDFGYRPLLEALYAGVQGLVQSGTVRVDEAARMAIPTVGRSLDDLREPFAAGLCPDLTLEVLELFMGADDIWEGYRKSGDAAAYARRWADFTRASVFPTLALAIKGADSAARRAVFSDRLTDAVVASLQVDPAPMKIPLARMVVMRAI